MGLTYAFDVFVRNMTMPNNAKHTPGEWVVVDASQVAVKLRNHNGEEYTSGIATLYSGSPIPGKSYEEGRAEMEANAALIARAPELLEENANLRAILADIVVDYEAVVNMGDYGNINREALIERALSLTKAGKV